ncbi:MAG: methenyltetrahydromethanopterin cyclohydrolase [Salinirussus sp.]
MDPLNRSATELVDEAIDFADELGVTVHPLEGDAAVLDFGVEHAGGLEAGLLLAEIVTAGLASVHTAVAEIADTPRTHVDLSTDQPAMALLCASKAGWELSVDGFEGLGSGPARALVGTETVYDRVGYQEVSDFAVLAVESDALPEDRVARHVAEATGVAESAVFLPSYATASLTGSVLAAARAAELATYRLVETGYDPLAIHSVTGRAPVPPVAGEESMAMALSTDAVSYGGRVHLVVDEPVSDAEAIASSAATEYGRPFAAIFDGVGWEMAELSVELFGPAAVTIDVIGGQTHSVGAVHDDILADSFG